MYIKEMKKGFLLEKKKQKTDKQTPREIKQESNILSERSAKEICISKTDEKNSKSNHNIGWKKGFLNNSNQIVPIRKIKSNHKKATAPVDNKLASSDLLELENDHRDVSAWNDVFSKTKNQSELKSPLIVVQDDDTNESKNENRSEFQTINLITTVVSSVTHEEETPMIRELSSRKYHKNDRKETLVNLEMHAVHDEETVPQHDETDESSLPLPSLSLPTQLSILLSKLERLSKLKRRKLKLKENNIIKEEVEDEKACIDAFLKEFINVENHEMCQQSISNIMFVFDNIFSIIPSYSKSQIKYNWDRKCQLILPPCLVVGLAIFDISDLDVCRCLVQFWGRTVQSLDSVHENTNLDQLKREKVKLIGSFICIKMKICSWHSSKLEDLSMNAESGNDRLSNFEIDNIFTLFKNGTPCLSQLLRSSHVDFKRTVLAVHALETAFFIIEDASLTYAMYHHLSNSSTSITIKDFLQVKLFLQAQEKWWLGEVDTDDNGNQDHSKRLCQKGILTDWKLVIKAAEVCENNMTETTYNYERIYLLSKTLSGLYLDRGVDEKVSRSYGGIAQTMNKDMIITNFDSEDYISTSLNLTLAYIHDSLEAEGLEMTETAILRSICCWIIQKWNVIDRIRIQSECFDMLINTLKSKQKRSIDLITSIIYALWSGFRSKSKSNGDEDREDLLESSLRTLVGELNLSSPEIDAPSETDTIICILCARLILDDKSDFLGYFLSHCCLHPLKIYVIFILIDSEELSVENRTLLEDHLLVYVPKSKYLQRHLHSKDIMFPSLPTQKIVGSMFDIMVQEDPSSYLTSVASLLLSKIIMSRVRLPHNDLIEAFITVISKKRENQNLFDKHVRSWRRSLLSDSLSPTAYQYILESCAQAMFQDPSNETILNILGGFVGSSQDFVDVDDSLRNKIEAATEGVLLLASNELQRLHKSNVSDIFSRLSPLLLLRRIPHEHFRFEIHECCLQDLGREISQRLGLSSETECALVGSTSSEERRLLAEVAVRCFPFSSKNDNSCTGFSIFCEEVISSTFSLITTSQIARLSWKSIKLVIYIGCHLLQTSPTSLGNHEGFAFITFTMVLLNLNVSVDDEYYNFMTEVHTGCIDFLASYICAPYIAKLSPQDQNNYPLHRELVIDMQEISTFDHDKTGNMFENTWKGLQSDMLNLIRGESTEYLSSSSFLNNINSSISHDVHRMGKELLLGIEWTSESRMDLLNAFVIASQRCPEWNILSFAYNGSMQIFLSFLFNDNFCQPENTLCTASVLRFVFNILQRRKSFDALHPNEAESRALAAKLFDLSLRLTRDTKSDFDRYTSNLLRKEGLKMLMAIISVDQSDSGSKVVSTGNLFKAVSLLQELSNLDTDPDIRNFAQQLLTCVT